MPKNDPIRRQASTYPVVVPILSRFGDMDTLGHINNIAIAQYFEEARVSGLRQMLGGDHAWRDGVRVVIARLTVDYLHEATYPGTLEAGVGVLRVGNSSFTLGLGLFQNAVCVAVSDAVMVNAHAGGSVRLPEQFRSRLSERLLRRASSD